MNDLGGGKPERIKPFVLAAILFALIGSARIASTYKIFNFTIDEPAHAACGMEWLDAGKYQYEDQHPPLARVVAALGIRYSGEAWGGDGNMWLEGFRLLGGGARQERGLVYGRAAMLVFFWIGSAVVFFWVLRIGGPRAACYATLFFTCLPPVLAHSGLITTDMALSSLLSAAFLASLYWVEKPSIIRSVLLGVALASAVLAKFSALAFFPAACLVLYGFHIVRAKPRLREEFQRLSGLLIPAFGVALICAVVIWAGYRFSFGKVEFIPFRVPAPELFSGIASVWRHNSTGHSSYLLGMRSSDGFPYYFPVALFAKTPVALIFIVCAGLLLSLRTSFPLMEPLAYSIGVLGAALFSHINIGVRHVLPVYTGLSVAAGVITARMLSAPSPRWMRVAGVLLVAGYVASGALQHPDYLAYTNEIWWSDPEAVLADSDVDWGQDMKRLATRMRTLGVKEINFDPFNRGFLLSGAPFPKIRPVPDGDHVPSGWTAVSISVWKINGGPAWIDAERASERVGRSMLLFHAP